MKTKHTDDKQGSDTAVLLVASAVALLALLPRLAGFDVNFGRYLWSEDGPIFLNQAHEIGVSAVFLPYHGYLHLYPRAFAWAAQSVELINRPTILFLGWLSAYLMLVHAIVRTCLKWDRSILAIGVLVALVSLQPNSGEVFFTVTNLQWQLGVVLFLYGLTNANVPPKHPGAHGFLLLILALTGPFSIVLCTPLMIQGVVRKDWSARSYLYIPVILGGLVQACLFITSDRVSSGRMDDDVMRWVTAFGRILLFSPGNAVATQAIMVTTAALGIWCVIIWLLIAELRSASHFSSELATPFLLMFMAVILILAALLLNRAQPLWTVLPGGNRYTWIPYTLILTSVFMLTTNRRRLALGLAAAFSVICIISLPKEGLPDFQFAAFARLAETEPVLIPINPSRAEYPSWHVAAGPEGKPPSTTPLRTAVPLASFTAVSLNLHFDDGRLVFATDGEEHAGILSRKLYCLGSQSAALDVNIFRREAGWLRLFWSGKGTFDNASSMPRWYPSGEQRVQFAFPIDAEGVFLRLDPVTASSAGEGWIKRIEFICL